MTARIPAYFDAFLSAVRQGARIDHVHLGHWDAPGSASDSPAEFEAAQNRMTEMLFAMGNVKPGQYILDVGCGFGGLGRLMDARLSPFTFIGLNVDPRQLEVCRRIESRPQNSLNWLAADACALPFADTVFDRLFCVEAIFHFADRRTFLTEAFRVLKPSGHLVFGDILLQTPPQDTRLPTATIEAILETQLGPWPEKWLSPQELAAGCIQCGFQIEAKIDATANTLPSYRTIAPFASQLTGPGVMRILHEGGYLTYLYLDLVKPARSVRGPASNAGISGSVQNQMVDP